MIQRQFFNLKEILYFVILVAMTVSVHGVDHPEEMANLLAGSFTDGDRFSTGNTLPLVGRPWGFNHWSPQTKEGNRHTGSWWFKGSDHVLTWMRCTHQPSPWIGDWGWFIFSPQIGGLTRNPTHFWEPRGAVIKPHIFDAIVAPNEIRIELTPTDHGAIVRITFPAERNDDKHVCFAEADWDKHGAASDGSGQYLKGRAMQRNSERMIVSNFNMHVRVESAEATSVKSVADMRCFEYRKDAGAVTLRMATSLISGDQAALSLKRELNPQKSFDVVAKETKMVWNKLMRRANVIDPGDVSEGTNRHLEIFYTSLYRALTFPRRIDEVDASGKMVHYSPYDPHGRVYQGPLVTDNGFWDTFRTVYPLLSLVYPEHLGTIVQGWLNAYKEGGWIPSWASPGYRNCMVGTFGDVVVADAIVKNVPGFDLMLAKEALHKDAYQDPPGYAGGAVGKVGLGEYKHRGFLVNEVSRTLDYGFADYSTGQAFIVLAEKLSKDTGDTHLRMELRKQAEELLLRSKRAYTALFDKHMGLMTPKDAAGHTSNRFNPTEWGNGFTEGNAWHHSFPPYSVHYPGCTAYDEEFRQSGAGKQLQSENGGLAELYGGKPVMLRKLHQLLTTPSTFRVGSYRQEIHEMTEMRALAMGQYGHNNQPSHHILYLFALLGDPETTQRTVREVMDRAYGRDFFAGDEDNGEMGAWFVLSALGLFSVTPGTRDYVLGSPVFRHVRISRNEESYDNYYERSIDESEAVHAVHGPKHSIDGSGGHRYLDIIAAGTGPSVLYVDKVMFNDTLATGPTVDDAWLQQDGVLRFVMRGESNTQQAADDIKMIHRNSYLSSADGSGGGDMDGEHFNIPHFRRIEQELNAEKDQIAHLRQQLHELEGSGSGHHAQQPVAPRSQGQQGLDFTTHPEEQYNIRKTDSSEMKIASGGAGLMHQESSILVIGQQVVFSNTFAIVLLLLSIAGVLKILDWFFFCTGVQGSGKKSGRNLSLNDFNSPQHDGMRSPSAMGCCSAVGFYIGGIYRSLALLLRRLHIMYVNAFCSDSDPYGYNNTALSASTVSAGAGHGRTPSCGGKSRTHEKGRKPKRGAGGNSRAGTGFADSNDKVLMGGAAGVDGTDNTFYDGGGTRTAVITGTNRLSRTASKTAAAGNGTSSSITTHVV